MKWAEVSIQTIHEAVELVANIMHELGAGGVIIEDPEDFELGLEGLEDQIEITTDNFPEEAVYVKAFFPTNSYLLETIEQIKAELSKLRDFGINIGEGSIFIAEVHEDDWSSNWKQYYKPISISDKFLIAPVWENFELENPDQMVIKLDPGMAFGTGTHPSTVMCLQALEKTVKGNEKVIDVGCGTGVLSIAAAKLGAKSVLALDLDEVAIESTKLNIGINNVANIIEVKQNNLLNEINHDTDIVVANILAEVIVEFTNDVARVLKRGGIFITSGIIQAKADLVKESLEKAGMQVIDTITNEDWVALIAKKA